MNDERFQRTVSSWLIEDDITPPDSHESARQVAAGLSKVPQQGRWWPLPLLRRSVAPPRAMPDIEYQPSPIPATNGQSPTVTGRTQPMFSPARTIAAAALVFAIGGVVLIAQPFDQRGDSVPGAATDAEFVPPVEVTGTVGVGGCSRTRQEGDSTTLPGTDDQYTCTAPWVFSDPRLTGRVTLINENVYLVGNGLELAETLSIVCAEDPECEVPDLEILHSAMSLENEDGVWRQRPTVRFTLPGGCCAGPEETFIVMDGEGGYEGLVAVLEATGQEEDTTYYGFILDARQLKPAPENASTK